MSNPNAVLSWHLFDASSLRASVESDLTLEVGSSAWNEVYHGVDTIPAFALRGDGEYDLSPWAVRAKTSPVVKIVLGEKLTPPPVPRPDLSITLRIDDADIISIREISSIRDGLGSGVEAMDIEIEDPDPVTVHDDAEPLTFARVDSRVRRPGRRSRSAERQKGK